MHLRLLRLTAAAGVAFAVGCSSPPLSPPDDTTRPGPGPGPGPVPTDPPAIGREFRGLWVATVANIDWPSRAGLTADVQRAELTSIMDRAVAAGLNAIVLHVRPAGDALYQPGHEPWGAMLTGTQGASPGYDPLAFAVTEAHRRGLELHAWVNPFRAGNTADSAKLAPTHLFNTRRDLIRVYGTQLWMDPGEQAVHDHTMRVILDIVARYDVDAVHLDDYFYPYPQTASGTTIPFPDSASYARSGTTLSLADWRRNNVDRFVERLYREVHETKPWVRVGISPFGIWRPNNPSGIQGLDAYASIYADSRKWLNSGWLDYLAPQLYWRIDPPAQSFPALLAWWQSQNTHNRFVWPGIASYRVFEGTPLFPTSEIVNQVKVVRERNARGMLFYNTTATVGRSGTVANALAGEVFATPAIAPATTWLDAVPPPPPALTVSSTVGSTWHASIAQTGEPIRFYVVRYRQSSGWTTRIVGGGEQSITLTPQSGQQIDRVVVNAADRVGNLSSDVVWVRS